MLYSSIPMITEKQKQLLEKEPVAVATVNEDGSPNVIAVMAVKAVDKSTIVITDNYMKLTKDNILQNGRICLGVWTKEEGYKFIGKAMYYSEGKWLDLVKSLEDNKGYPAKGAIVITVEKIISLG